VPEQGFLASLFDTSFSSLITTRVLKVIYVLSMIVIGLSALAFIGAAFSRSAVFGLITLVILAPFFSLLYLVYVRVLLEIVIAIFRIMETNVELVALQRGHGEAPTAAQAPPPPPPAAPPTPPAGPPPSAPPAV
jgi:hypothetical protein